MVQHIKNHIGKKTYSCETCGKSFMKKEHVVYHKRIILAINLTDVKSVGNHSLIKEAWENMKEFILERNRTAVRYVGNLLHTKKTWLHMKENLTDVKSVENHSH